MKKLLFLFLALFALLSFVPVFTDTPSPVSFVSDVLVPDASALWTVTTNYRGNHSCSLAVTVTDPTSQTTNFLLSKGFLKGKTTPLWYTVTMISNGTAVSNRPAELAITGINGTNIYFRVYDAHNGSVYLRWRVILYRPHSFIK